MDEYKKLKLKEKMKKKIPDFLFSSILLLIGIILTVLSFFYSNINSLLFIGVAFITSWILVVLIIIYKKD